MGGIHWIIDAHGCAPDVLRDPVRLARLADRCLAELRLTPIGAPFWHVFPDPGGITGFIALAESHFACHTFPEHGSVSLDVFCCRPRGEWDAARVLTDELGAREVTVRRLERPYASVPALMPGAGR